MSRARDDNFFPLCSRIPDQTLQLFGCDMRVAIWREDLRILGALEEAEIAPAGDRLRERQARIGEPRKSEQASVAQHDDQYRDCRYSAGAEAVSKNKPSKVG